MTNLDARQSVAVVVDDVAYGNGTRTVTLGPAGSKDSGTTLTFASGRSFGWHDLAIRIPAATQFHQRFAGRVETGGDSASDPYMGRVTG